MTERPSEHVESSKQRAAPKTSPLLAPNDETVNSSPLVNDTALNHPSTLEPPLTDSAIPPASRSIQAVAIYEIFKGVGALIAAWLLWLKHRDLNTWLSNATALWRKEFGQLLIAQVDSVVASALKASVHWQLFVGIILGYASLRFIEAYGLWKDKTWAYWYSVIGYGIFIPLELYYLIVNPLDWFNVFIFILNIVIVIIVYRNMKRKGLI